MSPAFDPSQAVELAILGWNNDFSFSISLQVSEYWRADRAAKIHAPQNSARALVLFQRVKPAIARTTKRLGFAVPIKIGRNEVADGRFQGKGPAHLTGMVSVAENFIRRTHRTLLRERLCPIANHSSVSLRGNEFQFAIAVEVPQSRLTGVGDLDGDGKLEFITDRKRTRLNYS